MRKITQAVKLLAIKLKESILDYVRSSHTSFSPSKSKTLTSIITRLNIKESDLELPYRI